MSGPNQAQTGGSAPSPLVRNSGTQSANQTAVACQRDGTTSLPRAWDHLEVLLSIVGLALGVNTGVLVGAVSSPVRGAFDDEGVCPGGESRTPDMVRSFS